MCSPKGTQMCTEMHVNTWQAHRCIWPLLGQTLLGHHATRSSAPTCHCPSRTRCAMHQAHHCGDMFFELLGLICATRLKTTSQTCRCCSRRHDRASGRMMPPKALSLKQCSKSDHTWSSAAVCLSRLKRWWFADLFRDNRCVQGLLSQVPFNCV